MTKSAKLRRRVGVFVYNDKGQVFAEESPYRDTLRFPGGGVDNNNSINQAARMEVLEEAGLRLKDVHGVGVDSSNIRWSKEMIAKAKKKGRNFTGNKQYFRAGRFDKKDDSLFGVEGDQFKNGKWINIDTAIKRQERYGKSGGEFSDLSMLESEALRNLKEKIK